MTTSNTIANTAKIADATEYWGVGNCAEQAAVAFIYCYRHNVQPVAYMTIPWTSFDDHAFIEAPELRGRLPTSLQRLTPWATHPGN